MSDNGWGRGRRPVINVSWDDAQAYIKWLSGITGKQYRLLSEAEYEYAARAGTETKYPWGEEIKLNGEAMANCNGCGSQWGGKQTAPVGSFPANVFGLYDMVGNVSEWTEDCWNGSYTGSAGRRLAMDERRLQSPRRPRRFLGQQSGLPPLGAPLRDSRRRPANHLGFRVARTLWP